MPLPRSRILVLHQQGYFEAQRFPPRCSLSHSISISGQTFCCVKRESDRCDGGRPPSPRPPPSQNKKGKGKTEVRRKQQRVLCFLVEDRPTPGHTHLALFHSEPIGLSKYLIRLLLAQNPQGLAMRRVFNPPFSIAAHTNVNP
jgi:hypothetical protein